MDKLNSYRTMIDCLERDELDVFGQTVFFSSPCDLHNQFRTFRKELKFLKLFISCYQNWSHFFEHHDHRSASAKKAIEAIDCIALFFDDEMEENEDDDDEYDLPASLVIEIKLGKLQYIKTVVKESMLELTNLAPECRCSTRDGLIKLIGIAINSLKNLLVPPAESHAKERIGAVLKRLEFVFAIFDCGSVYLNSDQFNSFFNRLKDWANCAVAVALLYWVDEKDERLNTVVSNLIDKFKPCTLKLAELYLIPLMVLKPIAIADRQFPGIYLCLKRLACTRFLEVLVDDLVLPTHDGFEMFQHDLTFFVSFLINPPHKYAHGEGTQSSIHISVNEAARLISSLYAINLKEGMAKGTDILSHDSVKKMNKIKSEISELHKASSSWNNLPRRTDVPRFCNLFLENLFEKLIHAVALTTYQTNQIMTIQKKLLCLKPLLIGAFDLQDENEELKDLRMRICSMIYCVECVIDSFSLLDPTHYWHNAMCLADVTEEIQLIETELNKSRQAQIMRGHGDKTSSAVVLPPQASNIIKDDIIVGFEDEKERIINCLTGGLPQRDIVAIVGMPGQGKTTLAKKLYHDFRVRLHFQKYAWRCISQTYDIKVVFIDILKQVDQTLCENKISCKSQEDKISCKSQEDKISCKSQEDLAEMLYRCLRGRTYLIVLDDIWDIGAWNNLKASFPDDDNGSRIMFTSRLHTIALEAKLDCSVHELHPLSFEDSWQLLQLRLSHENDFPPIDLVDIGKEIVEKCNGLPLAIVTTAGLLGKVDANLASWKLVAENLNSWVAREGCMDILELSYKHLPDYLKPCFLHLAAFEEGSSIIVKRLTRLWVAEGFIRKHGTKSLEDVANEYLMDLVSRSLLLVAERSSKYGIKKCVVHDLVRELCLEKAKKENFLLVSNCSYNESIDTIRQSYLLNFPWECPSSFESEPSMPNIRTLFFVEPIHISFASSIIIWFRFLRVLQLTFDWEYYDTGVIIQQVHLRYLEIRGYCRLGSSIVNLSRLQFLILHSDVVPKSVFSMRNLQHLHLSGGFDVDTDDMVENSLQLDHLETFSSYHVYSTKEEFIWQLRRMPNVRKLGVRLQFCVRLSTFLSKLESLNMKVKVFLSATEFDLPSTLRKLTMDKPALSASILSLIGNLPSLEVLKLLCADFENHKWDVEGEEFFNLKYLKLQNSNITEWDVSTDSFPKLQQLALRGCGYLTEIPFRFGELSTLKVMKVFLCNKLLSNSVREIIAEQRDLGDASLEITTDLLEEEE